jgi:hypothetical protein
VICILATADVPVENFVPTESFKWDRKFMLKHLKQTRKAGDYAL